MFELLLLRLGSVAYGLGALKEHIPFQVKEFPFFKTIYFICSFENVSSITSIELLKSRTPVADVKSIETWCRLDYLEGALLHCNKIGIAN